MRRHDLAIIGLLFLLPLILFWQQTVGGRTLLPTENLYQYEPYATYREDAKAPATPHNHLLSDLVLQNYQWKTFIREQFTQGEIPLWNPHTFSGTPFMAAGQQSTLYPLSIIYYLMPLSAAYGWFTVINLWLAGVFMFLFVRGVGVSRFGATLSAITYQLCGMFVASAVHPMIIGAVVWMPLLLLMVEYTIRQRPLFGRPSSVPWVVIGAVALACNITSGHAELTIYTLLILAYYSAARLLWEVWCSRRESDTLVQIARRGIWLMALVLLGFGLSAVQLIPLYDFVQTNWRAERSDLKMVLNYAHPARDALQFLIPNFYGSPAHHSYFDVFTAQTVPVSFTLPSGELRTHTDWGMKNYVEAALYVGVLPLTLAAFATFTALVKSPLQTWRGDLGVRSNRAYILIFVLLTLISLTFMFGLPTYALVYRLPGINQLNTPFRWVYGVTIGVAVLAGFGADALLQYRVAARQTGYGLIAVGVLTLIGLVVSRVFYTQLEGAIQRFIDSAAKANEAFNTPAMFYSYQFVNLLIFGLMTLGAGVVFLWGETTRIKPVQVFAVSLVAIDLLIASWGFNAASDPALLDFTPPSVEFLQTNAVEDDWRYMVVNTADQREILPANILLRYGIDDVTGYDSIISKQYVDYMSGFADQSGALQYNRIAPLYTWDTNLEAIITSPRFARLNVRYLVTGKTTAFSPTLTEGSTPILQIVHEDGAVRIWQNNAALPRAYAISAQNLENADRSTINESLPEIISSTGRELLIDVSSTQPIWLVISQSYTPGWKAYLRPQGAGEDQEAEIPVQRVQENFQGIALPQSGDWTVRLIYSPTSFQVGVFSTIVSIAVLLLMLGTWMWRLFLAPGNSAASRLTRNSLAPILLNLFNRSIDLVFASIMFRILGVEQAGYYYYAIAIFGWFDIISNFGLDIYLMREAGRSRDRARYFFVSTSVLRFALVGVCIPLLITVLAVRQSAADPLNPDVLLTIALFYAGLVPGSLSKGLTSLFYAFEQAEYPAAITTITTISRIILGLGALLLGYGIVGLAGVSVITNFMTLGVLLTAARRLMREVPQTTSTSRPDGTLLRSVVGESFPLMLNHLLATIFFQIDVVLLEWIRDARSVGLYRVAYSWLLAINVIPAFFTQALMPIMSRQWQSDPSALKRTYVLAIKLLTSIAFPLAVVFMFIAEPLTRILGGSAYLPDGAIALQIMIWSIPIGWMNSLTQYALIAVNLQRRITAAFIIAVTFNISANLIFIPPYGYAAAALITIASEAVLFVPFVLLLQSALGRLNWFEILWRQIVATGIMLIVVSVLWSVQPLVALMIGGAGYMVVLLALHPLDSAEREFLLPYLPARLQRLLTLAGQGI